MDAVRCIVKSYPFGTTVLVICIPRGTSNGPTVSEIRSKMKAERATYCTLLEYDPKKASPEDLAAMVSGHWHGFERR